MNKRDLITRPMLWFWVALGLLLPWQIWQVTQSPWFDRPPKPTGDGPDYENIAFHIWKGHGFGYGWLDEEWRKPYEQADEAVSKIHDSTTSQSSSGGYAIQLGLKKDFVLNTSRPPLLPAVIAGFYCVLDRGPTAFSAIRIGFACCLAISGALAVAMAAYLVRQATGQVLPVLIASVTTLALTLLDRTIRSYATDFLTELPALLLTQCLVLTLLRASRGLGMQRTATRTATVTTSRTAIRTVVGRTSERPVELGEASGADKLLFAAWIVLSGVLLAALVLLRSIIVLWLPGIWLLVGLACWASRGADDRRFVVRLRQPLIVASGVLLVCVVSLAPWWIRNCRTLQAVMPLGTQGPITLLGGYSDESLEKKGEWQIKPETQLRQSLAQDEQFRRAVGTPQEEVIVSRAASQIVKRWASDHAMQLRALAATRLITEWGPYKDRILIVRVLMLSGLVWLISRRLRPELIILAGFVLLNSLVVMLLYSTGGRFLVPLYGIIYTFAGLGVGGWFGNLYRTLPRLPD